MTAMITKEQLKAIMPKCDTDKWHDPLSTAMEKYEINTVNREAGYLANVAVESGECRILEENLRYSAARMCEVWPKRFPDIVSATPYANNPQALANKVYGGRNGNGNEHSGDGWLYRGRGLGQLTGRANYQWLQKLTGLPVEAKPDMLLEPDPAALSFAAFFNSRGCRQLCDKEDLRALRRAINGGDIGLSEMKGYYVQAKKVLSVRF